MGRQFQLFYQGRDLSECSMRVLTYLLCMSLSAGTIVRREAEAEAVAEADPNPDASIHHGYHYVPACTLTPVRSCTPRVVETPRKVCQQVVDKHEDTTVIEECKVVTTTVCTQTSTTTELSSSVVDTSSTVVETGEPVPVTSITSNNVHFRHIKREAEAEPHYVSHHVSSVSVPVSKTTPPVCSATPEKTCKQTPVKTHRKVFRTVCDTVVDVTKIQDCTETVTRNCASTLTSSHTKVIGHETKVIE